MSDVLVTTVIKASELREGDRVLEGDDIYAYVYNVTKFASGSVQYKTKNMIHSRRGEDPIQVAFDNPCGDV